MGLSSNLDEEILALSGYAAYKFSFLTSLIVAILCGMSFVVVEVVF